MLERFEKHFMPEPNSGCWLWFGALDGYKKYGCFRVGKKNLRAHRVSWELYRGSIPKGMQVLHKCDVPPCVNPDHLWIGTQRDNVNDMIRKGRRMILIVTGKLAFLLE